MSMRVAKYPALPSYGFDAHTIVPGSFPPPPPALPNPAPIPFHRWYVTLVNMAAPEVFGKFTRVSKTTTEGMGDILAGHDWGMMQLHIPLPPVLLAPNMPVVMLGSSHKYFLPSYAVQETPQGGALAMAGPAGSAVAVTTPAFVINLQDCNEGVPLPTGVGLQIPSVRWVGFGVSDFLAGLISWGGDALSGAVASDLGSKIGGATGLAAGGVGEAILGAAINASNAAAQNVVNDKAPAGFAGTAAGYLGMGLSILGGPAAIGLASGRIADAVGAAGYAKPAAPDAAGTQMVPGETGLVQ